MGEKILVTRTSMPDYDEYCKLIKSIWDSHYLTNNGPLHEELSKRIIEYLGVDNFTLFVNGHLALENAINALDLHGEIITSPFTFISTTNAISRTNNVPVFCDINPDDYTMDVSKIESLITDKTVAILPIHVYGNVCDVEAIEKIAKKYNLKVVYDAAHAFGVKYKDRSIASYGDISMFSFHATKVFNTIEGGGLVYANPSLKEKLDAQKNFGIYDYEGSVTTGGNAKMNEFQAAMGILNIQELDKNIERRKKIVELYRNLLSSIKGIKMCMEQENVISNYSYFPIVIESNYGLTRDELYDLLTTYNIFARKYFYPISNQFPIYSDCVGETPIAKGISERVLTLPLYPDLDNENVIKICKIIKGGQK
ncbi:MAG: DegT/DnrJ/EryC1/StrS family aminotransferase [Bacilli bacterium]|nr:DegT/DnrJ/EryC1/StrS family aminotransferase [Bacilli bacterium]